MQQVPAMAGASPMAPQVSTCLAARPSRGTPHRAPVATRASASARGAPAVCAISVTELDERRAFLESKSLGELRTMARQYGVRGDTRAELIKLLMGLSTIGAATFNGMPKGSLSSAAPPPSTTASPSAARVSATPKPGATAGTGTPPGGPRLSAQDLQRMPLAALRTLARQRGVPGNSKEQLVAALSGTPGASAGAALRAPSPAPATGAPPAPASALAPAPGPTARTAGGAPGSPLEALEEELRAQSVSQLRVLARQKGLKGTNKAEIIKEMLALQCAAPTKSQPVKAASPTAPAAAPPAKKPAPARAAGAPGAAEKAAAPKSRAPAADTGEEKKEGADPKGPPKAPKVEDEIVKALMELDLGHLRYLAKERGLRGNDKEELVKLLAEMPPRRIDTPRTTIKANAAAIAAATEEALKRAREVRKSLGISDTPPGTPAASSSEASQPNLSAPSYSQSQLQPPSQQEPREWRRAQSQDTSSSSLFAAGAEVAAAAAAAAARLGAFSSGPPSGAEAAQGANRAYSVTELERMPLKQLKAVARRQGLPGNTRAQLIAAIRQSQDAVRPKKTPPRSPSFSPSNASTTPQAQWSSEPKDYSGVVEVLPPFQSDIPPEGIGIVRQVQPVALEAEIAELRGRVNTLRSRGGTVGSTFTGGAGAEGQSLSDDAVFLRNVLVGGLGLALIPVLLPVTLQGVVQQVNTSPNEELANNLNLEASLLLQSMLNQQTEVLTDLKSLLPLVSPEAAPEIRAAQAEEFCLNIPPTLKSADSDSFCEAVEALRAAKEANGMGEAARR